MAATNFCEMYDCRTTEFFRIDRFSDIFTPYHFKFIEDIWEYSFEIDGIKYSGKIAMWRYIKI